jgi:hypothetical protein
MKKLTALALSAALILGSFASPAFADKGNGKGHGGQGAEHGAKPNTSRSSEHRQQVHSRGAEHTDEGHKQAENENANWNENENDNVSAEPEEDDEDGKIGVCHATGNGGYVFIQVSRNALGHLEHHDDDIVDIASQEDCPATVAESE